MEKSVKIIETLANGYSSESTQRELSNEYQHDRVKMIFKNLCVFVLWMKADSALIGLTLSMLRLRLFKAQGRKDFRNPSKPCYVGIHWVKFSLSALR